MKIDASSVSARGVDVVGVGFCCGKKVASGPDVISSRRRFLPSPLPCTDQDHGEPIIIK